MDFKQLGASGLTVSVIALGAGLIGYSSDRRASYRILDRARSLGVTYIDTANSYAGGRSEETIGDWLKGRSARNEIVVSTKVGRPVGSTVAAGLRHKQIVEACEASLKRLRTDWIDLYMAHEPDPETPIVETLEAFARLEAAGKVRAIGLSNFDVPRLVQALDSAHGRPSVLQVAYSAVERPEQALINLAAERGLALAAYRPLAGGLLSGKYANGARPPGARLSDTIDRVTAPERRRLDHIVDRLRMTAAAQGVAPAAVALAWVLSVPHVTSAILGCRTSSQLEVVPAALGLRLSDADRHTFG
jgi:aryl-alcohol dehydrogenase (NADP+)